MWVPVVAIAAGASYIYKKSQENPEENYPAWIGKRVTEQGQTFNFRIPYIHIKDNHEIEGKGADNGLKFTVNGKVTKEGGFNFTQAFTDTASKITYDGKITGANRVTGVWKMVSGGIGYGTFDMQMEKQKVYVFTRKAVNDARSFQYPLHISANGLKIRAIGADYQGIYIFRGHITDATKIRFTIEYLGKTTVKGNGKTTFNNGFEGEFSEDKSNIKGAFTLAPIDGLPFGVPAPQQYSFNMNAQQPTLPPPPQPFPQQPPYSQQPFPQQPPNNNPFYQNQAPPPMQYIGQPPQGNTNYPSF